MGLLGFVALVTGEKIDEKVLTIHAACQCLIMMGFVEMCYPL